MSLRQNARLLDAAMAGQFAHLLPPRALTLAELVDRAVATQVMSRALSDNASDDDFANCDDAMFDARAELRAELMNLGLSKAQIDVLGGIL